jgi:imidazoleglycerol-phosphate dehydratase/histidinol-phosphatase
MVMVTNQDGIGSERFPTHKFELCHEFIMHTLVSQGIHFEKVLICPHTEDDGCACRKPKTKMIDDYLNGATYERSGSAVIGDRLTDIEMARRLGVNGLRIGDGQGDTLTWESIVQRLLIGPRQATVLRQTSETTISVSVDLNRDNPIEVSTGIGFFDHMLEQVAKHSGISLRLKASGDLHIDEHHTVEDCALALGQAISQALGERRGLARYGFVLPMDESIAEVAIDCSNRPVSVFNGQFKREQVGTLPTELVPHFFKSLSDALGAAIHVTVRGENTHHMIEACFKGLGRALRMALAVESSTMPSTKGVLM